jgi:hypothetical protein
VSKKTGIAMANSRWRFWNDSCIIVSDYAQISEGVAENSIFTKKIV